MPFEKTIVRMVLCLSSDSRHGPFLFELTTFPFFDHTLSDAPVESEVNKIIKQKQKFERLVITKEEGLELFQDNPFKVEILTTKVKDGDRTTVYKCGDLIDLCRGPHVPHTGKVKAFCATRHSATNWLGDTDNDSLQRIYGISFPDKKLLKIWKENQEKVRKIQRKFISLDANNQTLV
jgi:threonyl-tRNA synthetase